MSKYKTPHFSQHAWENKLSNAPPHVFFPLFLLLVFAVINETIHYTFTGCCSFKLQDHVWCFVFLRVVPSPVLISRSNNAQKRGYMFQDWMMTEDLCNSTLVKLKARDHLSYLNKNRLRRLTNIQHTVWNFHSAGRRW